MMRDLYLLAAGVLTGLAIPASALPQLPNIQPENYLQLWSLKESEATAGDKVTPDVETTPTPEFSNQEWQTSTESSSNLNSRINRQPLSGNQLYYQRIAALKVGQAYTRLPDDALQSLWGSVKSQSQISYSNWKNLLFLEGKAMARGQGINRLSILVGDSLSMWFPKEKLPAGKLWLNQGISGDTSDGVLKRLSAFSDTKPDVIYVMAGINDLRKGAKDKAILVNYRRIIRNLRKNHPSSLIIVQSVLPTRMAKISNNRIRQINKQLLLIAKEERANFLDIHTWFTDFEGNLRPDLTTDGLHLSQDGYEVWQSALQQIEFKLALSKTSSNSQVNRQ